MEPIQVYVGSDPRMGRAERVLEHSIRKHTTGPVEIVWMRAGDRGWGDEWEAARGRPSGIPYSGIGWATDFTCFRFAIPELAGFKGKAIYLDVDMIVLHDLRDLFDLPASHAANCMGRGLDVVLWNCDIVGRLEHWPDIEAMKSNAKYSQLARFLQRTAELRMQVDPRWDVLDRVTNDARLVHYTDMRTQPWHPWPERFQYPEKHPNSAAQELWEDYEREARTALETPGIAGGSSEGGVE